MRLYVSKSKYRITAVHHNLINHKDRSEWFFAPQWLSWRYVYQLITIFTNAPRNMMTRKSSRGGLPAGCTWRTDDGPLSRKNTGNTSNIYRNQEDALVCSPRPSVMMSEDQQFCLRLYPPSPGWQGDPLARMTSARPTEPDACPDRPGLCRWVWVG